MEDRIAALGGGRESRAVHDVAADERGAERLEPARRHRRAYERAHMPAIRGETLHEIGAHLAGGAGDQRALHYSGSGSAETFALTFPPSHWSVTSVPVSTSWRIMPIATAPSRGESALDRTSPTCSPLAASTAAPSGAGSDLPAMR